VPISELIFGILTQNRSSLDARRDAEIAVELSQENALTFYAALVALQSAWASARLDGRERGAMELRQALAAFTNQGNKLDVPFYQGFTCRDRSSG
jgi:hypothetical protein